MEIKGRYFRFTLILVLIFLCASLFAENTKKVIHIAIPNDLAETIDPHRATGALTFEILYNIYEGLVQIDEEAKLVPSLAKTWEISEDGKEYRFYLKENVVFHNGQPFSAADVVYSFHRLLDPKTGYAKVSNYKVIEDVFSEGSQTVVFVLNQVCAPFLALVSEIYIVPEGYGEAELDAHAMGTGPFSLKEWKRDQYLHLVKNNNYHEKGVPYLEEAYFRVIPDENSRLIALKSGVVDVLPRVDSSSLYEFEGNSAFTILKAPMNLVQVMALNNAVEPFNHPEVRQALQYAIDRDVCIELVAGGLARPLYTHLPPEDYYYEDFSGKYDYNPEKAKQLLQKAGYKNGCPFTLQIAQLYPFHVRTGEVILQMLNEAGFKAQLQIIEWSKWLSDVYRARQYQATIIGHEGEVDPYLLLDRFFQDSGRNYMNVKNPKIDDLLNQSMVETDPEKRLPLIHGILEELVENAVAFWIMEPEEIVLLSSKVKGWAIYPVYVDALKKVYIEP
jgi:peptide/nickel transport system substrate-binding protein